MDIQLRDKNQAYFPVDSFFNLVQCKNTAPPLIGGAVFFSRHYAAKNPSFQPFEEQIFMWTLA
jgi:hypothetical protein